MNEFIIVIPARLKSTRLPNKMMLLIGGRPVIEHTWREAMASQAKKVVVATDDDSIFEHMQSVGAEVVMTSHDHLTGTDRLAEVAVLYGFNDEDIIVNWQGDEPFLPHECIEKVVTKLNDNPKAAMSTLATRIHLWEDFFNPNIVKVVHDKYDNALYFSRSPIPFPRGIAKGEGELPTDLQPMRHIGVYGYRAFFLKEYSRMEVSILEQWESLEQLRALSNGCIILVEHIDKVPPPGIDTIDELNIARQWYQKQHNV